MDTSMSIPSATVASIHVKYCCMNRIPRGLKHIVLASEQEVGSPSLYVSHSSACSIVSSSFPSPLLPKPASRDCPSLVSLAPGESP